MSAVICGFFWGLVLVQQEQAKKSLEQSSDFRKELYQQLDKTIECRIQAEGLRHKYDLCMKDLDKRTKQ